MKTFHKQNGRCLQCGVDVCEVRSVFDPSHPLAGEPRQLGAVLPPYTQVRLQMSTGPVADVAFCLDCAKALEPADYWPVWRACLARNDLTLRLAGRSEVVRRKAFADGLEMFPLAITLRRTPSAEGVPMMDRR